MTHCKQIRVWQPSFEKAGCGYLPIPMISIGFKLSSWRGMRSLFQLSQFVLRIEIWGIPSNMTLGQREWAHGSQSRKFGFADSPVLAVPGFWFLFFCWCSFLPECRKFTGRLLGSMRSQAPYFLLNKSHRFMFFSSSLLRKYDATLPSNSIAQSLL